MIIVMIINLSDLNMAKNGKPRDNKSDSLKIVAQNNVTWSWKMILRNRIEK